MRVVRIPRAAFIKGGMLGAATLSAGVPAFLPRRGEAADALTIGVVLELTGTFAKVAEEERRGAALAAAWWNQRGGAMGRRVQVVVEDNQNDPGTSVEKARKLVNQDKAVALMGTVNSAASLSTSAAASAMGVVFMDSGGHADQISGKDCHRGTFQVPHTTRQLTHATGFSIAKLFGKKWYLITPDYAFGHALAAGYAEVAKSVGGEIVANDLTPVGTSDFSPYLTKIAAAKPDALLVLVQGADWVNCLKQAGSFGILEKIPVAGPFVQLSSIWAVPPEARVGYWGTEWYYKGDSVLGAGNTQAQRFVREYRRLYNEPPTENSCCGFTAMDRLLWAVSESKSTDAVKIAHTLEDASFHGLWTGASAFRRVDHALQWPVWFGKLNPQGTPGDPHDVLHIVDRQEAADTTISPRDAAKVCRFT